MKRSSILILLLLACLASAQQQSGARPVDRRAALRHRTSTVVPQGNYTTPSCLTPHVVTSFIWNSDLQQWPESLAIDAHGNMYVSLTDFFTSGANDVGYVVKVKPDGSQTIIASVPDLSGWGFLTGVALDKEGRLYLNVVNDNPGVYRVERDGTLKLELALPTCSTPNGIAFRHGVMYVSDSTYNCTCGAIFKKELGDIATTAAPWYSDCDLIAPGIQDGLGANGIAFYKGQMYIGVYDAGPQDWGRIVRLPVNADGSPGSPSVVVEDPLLQSVDGIAFDAAGKLWVVMNYDGLGTVSLNGKLQLLAQNPGWLDDPTMLAFGKKADRDEERFCQGSEECRRGHTSETLFLTNGGGTILPGQVISLDVGVRGLP